MKAITRLRQYIDHKGVSNSSFEKKIGLSNGYIGIQLKRNADIGEGMLNKILDNCLDINPEWLLTGRGAMLRSDAAAVNSGNNNIISGGSVYYNAAQTEKIKELTARNKELEQNNHRLLSHQEALIKQISQLLAQIDRKDEEIQRLRAQAPPTI